MKKTTYIALLILVWGWEIWSGAITVNLCNSIFSWFETLKNICLIWPTVPRYTGLPMMALGGLLLIRAGKRRIKRH